MNGYSISCRVCPLSHRVIMSLWRQTRRLKAKSTSQFPSKIKKLIWNFQTEVNLRTLQDFLKRYWKFALTWKLTWHILSKVILDFVAWKTRTLFTCPFLHRFQNIILSSWPNSRNHPSPVSYDIINWSLNLALLRKSKSQKKNKGKHLQVSREDFNVDPVVHSPDRIGVCDQSIVCQIIVS